MIYLRFNFLIVLFCLFSTALYSQKIIAFDKGGKTKRVKYYTGDVIKFKTVDGTKHQGVIVQINDSSFNLNGSEFNISKIKKVYNTQKNVGFRIIYKVAIRGAYAYFPLITANRAINNDNPVLQESALRVSGIFLGTSLISNFIANKPYKMSTKRPLKIIDISL